MDVAEATSRGETGSGDFGIAKIAAVGELGGTDCGNVGATALGIGDEDVSSSEAVAGTTGDRSSPAAKTRVTPWRPNFMYSLHWRRNIYQLASGQCNWGCGWFRVYSKKTYLEVGGGPVRR